MMKSVCILLLIPTLPLAAQWLNYPEARTPRTKEGKPNLTAPAPRTPDGKPDLSGLWLPELNPYNFDVIQDLKDEGIFRPAAEAVFKQNLADFHRGEHQWKLASAAAVRAATAAAVTPSALRALEARARIAPNAGGIAREIFARS